MGNFVSQEEADSALRKKLAPGENKIDNFFRKKLTSHMRRDGAPMRNISPPREQNRQLLLEEVNPAREQGPTPLGNSLSPNQKRSNLAEKKLTPPV